MPEESIESLKKQIIVLEQKVSLYEKDPSKKGYYSLRRIINQQIDYLNGFNIKGNVGGKASEDATYARTKDMWEGLPKMITSLNDLGVSLKITAKDEDDDAPFIETVAETRR